MKLRIKEDVDFINSHLGPDNLMDIQWQLYRSILSKKSRSLDCYAQYKKQEKEFYDLVYDVATEDEFNRNKRINKLVTSLEDSKSKLKDRLSEEDYRELSICVNKIIDYLKELKGATNS